MCHPVGTDMPIMGSTGPGGDRLARQPELIIALIGALGADVGSIVDAIQRELRDVGYRVGEQPIKLSRLMHRLPGPPFDTLKVGSKIAGVEAHMDAGSALRERLGPDALAMFAVSAIRVARKTEFGEPQAGPARGVAFILDSLKHQEEVETLRRLYGPAFIAVGVYTPYRDRLKAVCKRLRDAAGRGNLHEYEHEAERLIEKDKDEQNRPFGQHVSDAFALADVVVSSTGSDALSIRRFLNLLFGDWTKTPTRDEVGMVQAQIAAYQSSSMARQVGAAICRPDGSIVATGTNDVPKYDGGIYDADDLAADRRDVRDFALGFDTSDDHRRELLEDILKRLIQTEVITTVKEDGARSLADSLLDDLKGTMRRAKFMGTIDYIRAMHAEAAAFSNAARHGISVHGCTLYVTTFPCHDCAKQIIADGIHRVVYVEPYAKSLAQRFYDVQINVDGSNPSSDSVAFEPFVGVAPRRFRELFAMSGTRKDANGNYEAWTKRKAVPRLPDTLAGSSARTAGEAVELRAFNELVERNALVPLTA